MHIRRWFVLLLIGLIFINCFYINGGEFLPVTSKKVTFSDVADDFWAREAIEALGTQGIISGSNNGTFKPNDPITRAEFTKIIVELLQLKTDDKISNPFTDLQMTDWFYGYVLSAYTRGLVNGKSSSAFYPNASITREEVFTIVYRMMQGYALDGDGNEIELSSTTPTLAYSDGDDISSFAEDAMNTLMTYNLLSGYSDNSLRPQNLMTRAEATTVIFKVARTFELREDLVIEAPIVVEATVSLPLQAEGLNGNYQLTESSDNMVLWTDYPSERTFRDEKLPTDEASGIHIYLAKDEFEPFQLVLKPVASHQVTIQLENNHSGIDVDLYQVMYVNLEKSTDNMGRIGLYPDPLYPVPWNTPIDVSVGENNPFWFSLHADDRLLSGDYSMAILIDGIRVPVHVHVFDFAIPKELHIKSQINVSTKRVLDKYGVTGTKDDYWPYVDSFKQFFMDHRLTPKSALWSGGLTSNGGSPYIDYDSASGTFNDPHGIWGFETPAERYLDGTTNNVNPYIPLTAFNDGVGFPSFMALSLRNNDASADQRPDSFDGVTRNSTDWFLANNVNTAFNHKWFKYIEDIESYLTETGYIDKAYYYVANEPQDQEDYDAVSWYTQELKKAAPNLKLMVSEEPKPEIYDNDKYPGAKVDQWLAVLNNYDPVVSWDREVNHNEETWIYFLYGTKPPYFNPITLDHPGIESKLTGWFLWKYRIEGIAHYSFNNWSNNVWQDSMTSGHNGDNFMLYPPGLDNRPISYGATDHRYVSSIRFELMRDSLEDYEYLYVLNNGNQPEVNEKNTSDEEVDKIIYGLTSYNRDSATMYTLRKYIGLKISGHLIDIPDIEASNTHERAQESAQSYYINFQDPSSSPTDIPLIVDGKTYRKIGWNTYDETLGYGWYGDMAHVMYKYQEGGPNPLMNSILYDDWGREKTFEFDLPNGNYEITVSCGWANRTYKRNKITIEGIRFISDEATDPYLIRTHVVQVRDNKLTMEMGLFDEYTMLNYMDIVAIE